MRTGLDPDDAVDLEDPQRLTEGSTAGTELRQHLGLRRQTVTGAQILLGDLSEDPPGEQLGDLLRPLHPQPRIGAGSLDFALLAVR